jgi:GcrA cell cycle regulator
MGGAELARELWDAGVRTADIGREVGTTSDAIVGYAHRHGWPPHPRQPVGAEWRAQRKAAGTAQKPPKARQPPRPAPPPAPAVAAPVAARGPRREACNPEPPPVPTRRFHGCQWIAGDDRRTWVMCGAPVAPRGVYCAEHRDRCYYRTRWHAEVAA